MTLVSGRPGRTAPGKELAVRAALLLASVLVVILAGEVTIRAAYGRLANYDMEMWRYARELKEPTNDADLPFVNRPAAAGRYYGVEIRTNSFGCRSEEIPAAKGEKRRILFLGDSFTLGFGVPYDRIFTSLLGQRLADSPPGFEIVNAGVGNYNSMMELQWFRKRGLQLRPDVVVLMYYLNDVEPTPLLSPTRVFLASHSYLYAFLASRGRKLMAAAGAKRYSWKSYYQRLYDDGNPSLLANRDALDQLAALCRKNGIRLFVANIPDLHELEPYPFSAATSYIERASRENLLPFLDLQPLLSTEAPGTWWVSFEDTHANAAAHEVFAAAILGMLCREGAVPCEPR